MTPELKQQIENEAEFEASMQFHKKYSPDQWQACVITYRQGATQYAEKWQESEQRVQQCEKALKLIEQMSDPGSYEKAVYDMKSIASDALNQKNGING